MRFLAKTLLVVAVLGFALFYALTRPATLSPGPLLARTANLANGETMFNAGGCASCHATPKQDDKRRLGGGLALCNAVRHVPGSQHIVRLPAMALARGPKPTFVNAMLRGVGRNGEHLYPAFPYTSYQRMTLDDVRDLFAFLKTLPAETSPSRAASLAFPFNVRRGLGLWKLLYLDGKTFAADPAKSAQYQSGCLSGRRSGTLRGMP